jgi:hypothetical protein
MSLAHLLLFLVPAALVAFKMTALVTAAVWALSGAFGPQGLLAGVRRLHVLPAPARSPRSRERP